MRRSDDILSIGELAKRAQISVRALRHYESLGLLNPARDPDNNRRRYTQADITQVMKITALKLAGLDLRTIGKALNGGIDMRVMVAMQIRQLQTQHEKTQRALVILQKAADRLDDNQPLGVDLLCNMMRSITMTKFPTQDVIKNYFDDEQLNKLNSRGTTPAQMQDYQKQWSDLIARVQKLTDANAPADSDEALACAREWNALIGAFTQGDVGITQSLTTMYADKEAWNTRAHMPYGPHVGEYIAEAQGALLERGEE